jgi:hypothetical protein
MKIVVTAEKAGQVVAQSEREVTQEDLRKTAQKAFARLWKQKPALRVSLAAKSYPSSAPTDHPTGIVAWGRGAYYLAYVSSSRAW